MTGTTISGSYSSGLTLSNPAAENPATVTGTIEVAAGTALQGVAGTAWTVANQGRITSTAGLGVALADGGVIDTTANALIAGSTAGAYIQGAAGTVTNFGTITASAGPGVHLAAGGTVVDEPGAWITGNGTGVLISGAAGTVVASGTIAGIGAAGVAVAFAPGYANLLVAHPGATFIGTVDGGNPAGSTTASSTLELAPGVSSGTIGGIGSLFVDFTQVTLDAGAAWTFTGSSTIATGVTLTDAGSLSNAGTLDGAGYAVVLASGANLTNAASGTLTGAASAIYSPIGSAANTVVNYGSIGAGSFVAVGLREGGTLSNASGGTISGSYAAVYVAGAIGTVTNAGLITAASGHSYSDGIGLFAGGTVTNAATGTIASQQRGIAVYSAAGNVVNAGHVTVGSGGKYSNGIGLFAGGTVTNSGTIAAYLNGIAFYNVAGTATNFGNIDGTGFIGVALNAGGSASNAAGGIITGGYAGIYAGGTASTVTNAGTINAGSGFTISTGVALFAGGTVINDALGGIGAAQKGVAFYSAAGTLTNAGSIGATASSGFAASFAAGFANLLVDDPGAVFTGPVDGGNTIGSTSVSTLELAATSLQGTISGLGSQFIDFAQVIVDPGATWSIGAGNSLAAGVTLTDRGTLLLNAATLAGAGRATISGMSGDFANARVTGVGAIWSGSAALVVGQDGSGRLLVDNQGTVQTGGDAAADPSQGFDIAQSAGGAGDVVVAGSLSLLGNSGRFVVGDAGFGTLVIEGGGTVITTPGTAVGVAGAVIGVQAGADGSAVNVVGAGSAWRVTGTLQVGNAAAGALAIAGGGSVSAGAMDAGATSGGSGNISVVGAGSALTLAGQLTVGDVGSGELSILNGAMVGATSADIGVAASGTGNVDIEGAGSHLDIANDLNIGDAGVGVLTLGNGTELTVGNNLVVGANGVLNQFGGSIDPSTITIVSGGRQGGHGTSTASVVISNAGTLFASGGTETVIAPLITAPSGKSGVLEIDSGGDLLLNVATVDATQSVLFTDGTGVLTIGTIGGFAATIVGVNPGDQIIVQGKSIASDSFNASTHVLTLFDGSSATIGTLQLGPSVDGSALLANSTFGLGVAPCFAAGTRISTERGEVAVEDLRVGDWVQIAPRHPHPNPLPRSGGGLGWGSAEPITWIGHRTVDCTRHPAPHKVQPIRVSAHAFGPNRPIRDLYLSPDHALYLNDVLIPVKHLVNGATITQVPRDQVTYFHIELPRHAILLAENLPAESYLDTGDRSNFANDPGPTALHPDFATRVWDAAGCAPLVVTGPQLEAVRHWLTAMATPIRRAYG